MIFLTCYLKAYEKAKIESILEKIAPTEPKKRKSALQLSLMFANYVKKNCYCCSFHAFSYCSFAKNIVKEKYISNAIKNVWDCKHIFCTNFRPYEEKGKITLILDNAL